MENSPLNYAPVQDIRTLNTPLNQGTVVSGRDNKAVITYLNMIASNHTEKAKQIGVNLAIQALLESTFNIMSPDGTVQINSLRLYQALWRIADKMKPLDYQMFLTGRPHHINQIVSRGISTTMERGGYNSGLRDKNGVFFSTILYGDGPMMIGMNPKKNTNAPILFTPISINNLYMDNFATGIRNRGSAGSAYRACAIFSYSWNQACMIWPKLKKIGGIGKIPRQENTWKDLNRDVFQTLQLEQEVEIGFGVDINARNFTIFAGQSCTILEEYNGKDFPFVTDDDEPYIPFLQFVCIPSSQGPYNHGLGQLLFKLSIVTSKLINLEYGHVEDNTYPITLVNAPQEEAANFFGKLAEATRQRKSGRKPFIAMGYDPNSPNSQRVDSQSLLTNNLFQEWQVLYNTLIDEIQMLGINLKELTQEGNPTATQILSDEENSNSWVKQMMEYNVSETQKAVEITAYAIKTFVPKTSKVPLNLTTKITVDGVDVMPEGITLGAVAEELRDNNFFVIVNGRSGVNPSNTMMRAKIALAKANATPGSKAWLKLVGQENEINDIDIPAEDFGPPQQEGAPQGAPQGGQDAAPVASATDRLTFNPRKKEQLPIF